MTSGNFGDPPVVRHIIQKPPANIYMSKSGQKYHLSPDCHFLASKTNVSSYDICQVCQQKAKK